MYESEFKLKNLAMAKKPVKIFYLKEKLIYHMIKKIRDVNGRLELIKKYPNNIKIFVDYAHTPDALLKTLKSLRSNYGNNISLVFGCGGERDKRKRPLMAKIANENCKNIYVTDDNPRNENPGEIRKELLRNICKEKSFNIGNRKLAIKKAIQNATPNEVVLIAGKGHEEKQIYKNKIINISDKQIVKNLNLKIKSLDRKKQNYLQNRKILSDLLDKKITFNFSGLSIDTRTIQKNNLFLAIKGRKDDGNKFIYEALKKGAVVVTSST